MLIRKKKNVPEYAEGERIDDIFAVRFKKPVEPYANGHRFELRLQDAGGAVMLTYWGGRDEKSVQRLYNGISADAVVQVSGGTVDVYKDQTRFSVNEGRGSMRQLDENEFLPSDFLRKSEKDAEKMMGELNELVASIKDEGIKGIVDSFFSDKGFTSKFKNAPGAMYRHHGWLNGLLEHSLSVAHICLEIAEHHAGELDRDLLIAGALLHDIGKLKEIEVGATMIGISEEGNLLGHVVLGIQMLTRKFDELPDVPENTKQKLLHVLISHHGDLESGSPKKPAFPEALVVAKADALDACVAEMIDLRKNASTEDKFVYSRTLDRNVYLG